MIIECEKCRTKFRLDETLLKKEGSKVRCSLCKHIFRAYPPNPVSTEEAEITDFGLEQGLEATLIEESPPFDVEEGTDAERPGNGASLEEESSTVDTEEDSVEDAEGVPGVYPQKKSSKSRFLLILAGIILLVLIGAAVAIMFLAPGLIPDSLSISRPQDKHEITDAGANRLKITPVNGSFVESKRAGRLFVIRGMVKNDYPMTRKFILVKGCLLNDKGQEVKTEFAYAGNTFDEQEIKVLPLEEIKKAMKDRYGMDRKNFSVAPTTAVPFTIVFENLPEDMSEFTVEPYSSSPG
ncbi:MAG: DUF3426 domain-containing protein [Thermodesulfobacteriota bacterium]|nr:DUF3426 domain-containing protein [Thermodesulfobacteriota bacterium]